MKSQKHVVVWLLLGMMALGVVVFALWSFGNTSRTLPFPPPASSGQLLTSPSSTSPEAPLPPDAEPNTSVEPTDLPKPMLSDPEDIFVCDSEANCPNIFEATVSEGCAPWDGPALNIVVKHDRKLFRVAMYSEKNRKSFEAGKNIVIEKSDSDGAATLCSLNNGVADDCNRYAPGEVEIRNPAGVFDKTSPSVRLDIIIKGRTIPVNAKWDSKTEICG